MALPLMPKATAVWLVDNTTLTFEQIAEFCGMHPMEIQGIADGEVATGIIGENPVSAGQLSEESIKECEADASKKLALRKESQKYLQKKTKGGRYTPVARRQDKPDAISWLTKYHPELTDADIVKLVGTTKKTIESIRERSHWNISNIRPRDPVLLGLCKQIDLDGRVAKRRLEKGIKEPVAIEPDDTLDQNQASQI